jgi:hypothetical protein
MFHHVVIAYLTNETQWKTDIVKVEWPDETTEHIEFCWREPLAFIQESVTDPSLMPYSHFHASQKYLQQGNHSVRLVDEPWTGDTWYKIEVSFRYSHHAPLLTVQKSQLPPDVGSIESVLLALHIWLDKGNMTRRVQLHPIVMRMAWLDVSVRNGSGNGGGVLIGFMPMVWGSF